MRRRTNPFAGRWSWTPAGSQRGDVPRGGVQTKAWSKCATRPPAGPPPSGRWDTSHVPSTLPDGDPAPPDGALPPAALVGLHTRPFGVYVHVPFCATRCGYCDFNTYTPGELDGSASPRTWLEGLRT